MNTRHWRTEANAATAPGNTVSYHNVLDCLRAGDIRLPPLTFELRDSERSRERPGRSDAVVRARWRDRIYDFDLECKPNSTPKVLRHALDQVRDRSRSSHLHPMVLTPYLSAENLQELEANAVSGLDLSGNGIVVVPHELLVFRTGAPNRFPSSAPIKNVYRGASSLVARVLLVSPRHGSVTGIRAEVEGRGGHLALSTVSKALKVLEEDLMVAREGGEIRLLQPEKLLDRLTENFRKPEAPRRFTGKLPGRREEVMSALAAQARQNHLPLAVTGAGSAGSYAVVARGELLSLYCPQLRPLLEGLPVEETGRFPNLELFETTDATVYFDLRSQGDYPWASPVQTYLELARGDKRDQETALQLRQSLLNALAERAA